MEAVKDTVLTMQDFDLNTISIDNIRPIPTVSDHLVTTLTEYIYPQYQQKTGKIFGGYPSDGFMLANVLDQFFEDYLTPQEREKYEFSGSLYTSYFVKNEIDNNRPVILSMLVYYMYNMTQTEISSVSSYALVIMLLHMDIKTMYSGSLMLTATDINLLANIY